MIREVIIQKKWNFVNFSIANIMNQYDEAIYIVQLWANFILGNPLALNVH